MPSQPLITGPIRSMWNRADGSRDACSNGSQAATGSGRIGSKRTTMWSR